MRCTTYCTASFYDLPRLLPAVQKKGLSQLHRDVVHTEIKDDKLVKGDVFCFSFGAIVCWGFSEEEEREFLFILQEFEKEPLPKPERDDFTFSYGDSMKIEEDEIQLQNKSNLTKLAISHGLAQSVKLVIFEETIQKTVAHSQLISTQLIKRGKIPLSRKEISRKMGEMFLERSSINLHTEVLDTPEFFWEHPELEPFYKRTTHYLDVSKRVELLNRRLSVVHELFEILSSELNHQRSSRLEWTIIILIIMEVVLTISRDIFHII